MTLWLWAEDLALRLGVWWWSLVSSVLWAPVQGVSCVSSRDADCQPLVLWWTLQG